MSGCQPDYITYEVDPEVPKIAQPLSTICWLACWKMMCLWKGVDFDEAVKRLKNAGIDTTQGLLPEDWPTATRAVGLYGWPNTALKSIEGMMNALETYGPVTCFGDFLDGSPGSLHAMLIHGYELHTEKRRLRLFVHDPWELYFGRDTTMFHSQWCDKVDTRSFSCQLWW